MTTVVAPGAAGNPAGAVVMPDAMARDCMMAWFRGEFAAANAIIDALCAHLGQIGSAEEYESVFAAVHRRRMNWIPVLHMQKYYSIADVAAELNRVAACRAAAAEAVGDGTLEADAENAKSPQAYVAEPTSLPAQEEEEKETLAPAVEEDKVASPVADENEVSPQEETAEVLDVDGAAVEEAAEQESSGDSSDHKGADDGEANGDFQGEQTSLENIKICADHEDCFTRPERIKIVKGFVAKEAVKGHMVNVVKGLKMYENIFTDLELRRLAEYINELRVAGHNGELSGETFIFFNKEMKGNKREIIQLGVPLFQSTNEEATSNIEPIPPVLQTVIDHLVQWRLIPESRKPNSCVINFFDEDEHSQPYFKPPHFENPISTLLLSETTMTFGRALVSDHDGNYKGSLTVQIKEGSLLVMRGNSADMARNVICASPNRRVSITFVKVRSFSNQIDSPMASPTKAMTLWKPATPPMQKMPSTGLIAYGPHGMIPTAWGLTLRAPVVMMAPPQPMVMTTNKKMSPNGTGVFLPWTVGPKKYTKHLPPRIQKRRLSTLPSVLEAQA